MSFQLSAFQNDAFQTEPVAPPTVEVIFYGGGHPMVLPLWPKRVVDEVVPGEVEGIGEAYLSALVLIAIGIVERPTVRDLVGIATALLATADTDDELVEALSWAHSAKTRAEAEGTTIEEVARRLGRGKQR